MTGETGSADIQEDKRNMKIVVLEPLGVSEAYVEKLAEGLSAAGHEFVYNATKVTDTPSLIARGQDADILVVANMPLKGEVIEGCPNVKCIAVAFTGVDHVDLETCKKRGIAVSNAAGYSTNAVAELVFGLAIGLYRSIPACDGRSRTGGTKDGLVGPELHGKTMGIVGTGAIGCRVAAIASAFGCRLLAYSRTERPEMTALGATYVSLEELMEQSDIVSLHVPVTPATKGLIGRDMLARMKKNAILINTARGPVVDNQALAEALTAGQIAGAGIDVFDMEPPIPEDYPLLKAPNTILTPHVAFATLEAMEIRADITVSNIEHWIAGDQINVILSGK